MRVLYIHGTIVPPAPDLKRDPFFLLSEGLEGDILHPIWFNHADEVERLLGPGSLVEYKRGRFRYHWFLAGDFSGVRRKIRAVWFYISQGLRIYREQRYDCIVTYSHMATGLSGVVLKLLTGAKLIVEVTTSPGLAQKALSQKPGLRGRIKNLYSDVCLHICLWSCNRAQLRGPGLIASYRMLRKVPVSVMAGFVPVSLVPCHIEQPQVSVLFIGAPWYLKGADILIAAFKRLEADFPDVKLNILGYYDDADQLKALTAGSTQIEVLPARTNPEALDLIARSNILVLPSRCEGTPRAVIEAMTSGIPAIGSDVGGIPYLIREGQNGFVVPVGDVAALEARLRQLLSDPELRMRMGARGREIALEEFSEKAYVAQFTRAVAEVVNGVDERQASENA